MCDKKDNTVKVIIPFWDKEKALQKIRLDYKDVRYEYKPRSIEDTIDNYFVNPTEYYKELEWAKKSTVKHDELDKRLKEEYVLVKNNTSWKGKFWEFQELYWTERFRYGKLLREAKGEKQPSVVVYREEDYTCYVKWVTAAFIGLVLFLVGIWLF